MEAGASPSSGVGFNPPSSAGLIFICKIVFICMCEALTLHTPAAHTVFNKIEMKNSSLNPPNTKSIEILLQSLFLKLLLF